jgi:pimeloyl-ACP methyl ester carboxylesterase
MGYQESFVQRDQYRIRVREYPGREPTIILMHGFPDNLHLYDRLFPCLSPPRRVVAFDFLGWGASDKPLGFPFTATSQVGDLDAVITQLRLQQVILVAHDASGPPAIDCALANSERVAGLVLLNTYYCAMPTLRPPEAIWLFSTPVGQKHRATCVADVRSLDLPTHVPVAGWEIFQRRGGQREVRATALPAVRCHAKRSSCLLSLERRFIAHYQVGHKNASVGGDNHLVRSCCLTKECNRVTVCRLLLVQPGAELSTAAGVACDERPTRWITRVLRSGCCRFRFG